MGRYAAGGVQELLLASGLWTSIDDIGRSPVSVQGRGRRARAGHRRRCSRDRPIASALMTGNGRDAASISVSQQVGANILEIEAGVEDAVGELARACRRGCTSPRCTTSPSSSRDAIANVRDAILIGGVLAVIVLLLFLRDWRLTLIAAVTLPLTVFATFALHAPLRRIDQPHVHGRARRGDRPRHRRRRGRGRGNPPAGAGGAPAPVAEAIADLMAPVVGSTLTTVVVFAPLGLLSGVVGQFFRALSLTLSAAVLASPSSSRSLSSRCWRRGESGARPVVSVE